MSAKICALDRPTFMICNNYMVLPVISDTVICIITQLMFQTDRPRVGY